MKRLGYSDFYVDFLLTWSFVADFDLAAALSLVVAFFLVAGCFVVSVDALGSAAFRVGVVRVDGVIGVSSSTSLNEPAALNGTSRDRPFFFK